LYPASQEFGQAVLFVVSDGMTAIPTTLKSMEKILITEVLNRHQGSCKQAV